MTKLTTRADPPPISHRSRSVGGQFLIPLMGRPFDPPADPLPEPLWKLYTYILGGYLRKTSS